MYIKKEIFSFLLLVFCLSIGKAQQDQYQWRVGAYAGLMNYHGDLNQSIVDGPFQQIQKNNWTSTIAHGISLEKKIHAGWGLQLFVSRGQFFANDRANSGSYYERSLNANTRLWDASFSLRGYFDNGKIMKKNSLFSPYWGIGISYTHFNVFADLFLEDGTRYYYWDDGSIRNLSEDDPIFHSATILEQDHIYETSLKEVETETEAAINSTFNIPLTLGFKFRLSNRLNLNLEATSRYTFTDRLEDVGGLFAKNYDNVLAAYASNPNDWQNESRGNVDDKLFDIYSMASISLHYNFGFDAGNFQGPIFFTKEGINQELITKEDETILSNIKVKEYSYEDYVRHAQGTSVQTNYTFIVNERGDTINGEVQTAIEPPKERIGMNGRRYPMGSSVSHFIRESNRLIKAPNGEIVGLVKYRADEFIPAKGNPCFDLMGGDAYVDAPEQEIEAGSVHEKHIYVSYNAKGEILKSVEANGFEPPEFNLENENLETLKKDASQVFQIHKAMIGSGGDSTCYAIYTSEFVKIYDGTSLNETASKSVPGMAKDKMILEASEKGGISVIKKINADRLLVVEMNEDLNILRTEAQDLVELEAMETRYAELVARKDTYTTSPENTDKENKKIKHSTWELNNELILFNNELAIARKPNAPILDGEAYDEREAYNKAQAERIKAANPKPVKEEPLEEAPLEVRYYDEEIKELDAALVFMKENPNKNDLTHLLELNKRINFLENRIVSLQDREVKMKPKTRYAQDLKLKLNSLNQMARFLKEDRKEVKTVVERDTVFVKKEPTIKRSGEIVQSYQQTNVFFLTNSSRIEQEYYAKLDKLIDLMKRYPDINALIKGYTDKSGNPKLNFELSKKRGGEVERYFISRGISAERLDVNQYGEEKSVANDEPFQRRVEIELILVD